MGVSHQQLSMTSDIARRSFGSGAVVKMVDSPEILLTLAMYPDRTGLMQIVFKNLDLADGDKHFIQVRFWKECCRTDNGSGAE